MRGKVFFLLGGISLLMIFLLHILIAVKGGNLYRYFGAGEELAQMSEKGSVFPALITLLISLVFLIMSFYAFSGAKVFIRLPFLRLILLITSVIFILRGLLIIPDVINFISSGQIIAKSILFSLISLIIGILLITGTCIEWKLLNKR